MKIAEKLKGGGKGGRDVGPGRPGGVLGWGGACICPIYTRWPVRQACLAQSRMNED